MRTAARIAIVVAFWVVLVEALATLGLRVLHIDYTPLRPPFLNGEQRAQLQALVDHRPSYMAFDPTLGWTNRPSSISANGLYHTNAQGFRGVREYSAALPPERVRVVAYGDSYTQSDDVDEDDTWAAQLEKRLPGLETLNAGVSGYTVDQAFLRFQSQSAIAADVVLIGFTGENINRVVNVFRPFYVPNGTPLAKPRFVLRGDDLALLPNPLRDENDLRRLLAADAELFAAMAAHDYWYDLWPIAGPEDAFATVRLGKTIWSAAKHVLRKDSLVDLHGVYQPTSEGFLITKKIFERFVEAALARDELPVIVFFPNTRDLLHGPLRRYAPLARALRDEHFAVIDCADGFDEPATAYGVTEESLHYSPAANGVVAETIARYFTDHDLLRRDGVRAALARHDHGSFADRG